MRVSLTHRFPCSPEKLWDVFDSDAFEERFGAVAGVTREITEDSVVDGVAIRRRKCTMTDPIPGVVARFLGSDRFEWDEEARLDRKRNRLEWVIELPAAIRYRVQAKGTTRVRPDGDGCVRTINGDIVVRVPVIGGRVEAAVAKNVSESYEKAAAIALDLLKES